MARYMQELEGMLCDELDKIAEKGELTAGTLDTVQKLTHSIKSLKTIEAMDDYSGDDYSYARRDSRGRYSRKGYSRDKQQMMEQLDELKQSIQHMK